ncbi:HAD family hydrolase [Allonocardiopsis opalescens]|nr:HAD family hydrolase [Allonocardiopsis opalescens]
MAPSFDRSMPPRLVATDLDGTIVRSDGTVSARTLAAFTLVERAGSVFVLVTGRPPRWMREIADSFPDLGLAICANGALVYDLRSESVVQAHLIEPETVHRVAADLRAELPELAFAVEFADGFQVEAGYHRAYWDGRRLPGECPMVDTVLDVHAPAAKLLVQHPAMRADALLARVGEILSEDLVTVTHSSYRGLLELSAAGVSKATTLARLCADLGIGHRDVLAFGDMPNDLPMLAWAGGAYAVANAHPTVLAAVADHTESNDDDGVARVLERLFG